MQIAELELSKSSMLDNLRGFTSWMDKRMAALAEIKRYTLVRCAGEVDFYAEGGSYHPSVVVEELVRAGYARFEEQGDYLIVHFVHD